MSAIDENSLSTLLVNDVSLRNIESHIYSVLANNEVGNTYDNKFGTFYDLVACNPIYNRLIWGSLTSRFPSLVDTSGMSFSSDLNGSMAFIQSQYNYNPS